MRLGRISEHASELRVEGPPGGMDMIILFSYQSPVAVRLANGRIVRTADILPAIPLRHLDQFVQRTAHQAPVVTVSQSALDALLRKELTCSAS